MFNLDEFNRSQENLSWKVSNSISLQVFEILTSTNEKAWELLDLETSSPLAVLAQKQTAGRGQWGRQWNSDEEGLYFSIPLKPKIAASNSAHLTLSTAWGIAHALRRYHIPVVLKWPNDLILAGRKLGGILSETRIQQGQITQAVVGVGINWNNIVPETGITLKSFLNLREQDKEKGSLSSIDSLETLSAIAMHGLLWGYQQYLTQGIESILTPYLKLLHNQGQKIIVEGCPGIVVGVAANGDLRIRLESPGASVEILRSPGTINLGYD